MRIDPQRLLRLAVLIEHGSFRRAAAHLGLTQPALSQSIAQIEKDLGVKLIERSPHGVEPTAFGRVLYEHAKSIDRELAHAAQNIQNLASGEDSPLAIGTNSGGAASLVALSVCKLNSANPRAQVRIHEEQSVKTLLRQLHDHTLDVLICQRPQEVELKGTQNFSLFCTKRVVCVRMQHPLARNATLSALSGFPFVYPQEELGLLIGLQKILSGLGLKLPDRKIFISNSFHVTKDIVLNSDAFALFSEISVIKERQRGQLKAFDLDIPTQYWLQLILRAEQKPTDLTRSFVVQMLAACKELKIEVNADAFRFRSLLSSADRGRTDFAK